METDKIYGEYFIRFNIFAPLHARRYQVFIERYIGICLDEHKISNLVIDDNRRDGTFRWKSRHDFINPEPSLFVDKETLQKLYDQLHGLGFRASK
jgi:hypothetical protein